MTTAIIVLAVIVGAQMLVLLAEIRSFRLERHEWNKERQRLVDRVIARHAGEIIVLDKLTNENPQPATGPREELHPVGL